MDASVPTNFYLTGGAVRNIALGRKEQKDLDVLLDGSTLDMLKTGLAGHGTIHIGAFGHIAWYPEKEGHFCWEFQVISKTITGLWPCEDIIDVLNCVDFTGNAIAYDMRTGEVFDPLNGCRDMARRILRGVRFDRREDRICDGKIPYPAAIWIRNMHYASALGLHVEPVTAGWLRAQQHYEEYVEVFSTLFFKPRIDPALLVVG
ncbi:hypothetical protein [Myxococcus vastator]|uniref:hypothetical protein n=1 Tax=Myxococcus vastator TaxID=2709664 RepID=UPI0013D5F631|nr:hypothetical protein [Myxococcus vastator]